MRPSLMLSLCALALSTLAGCASGYEPGPQIGQVSKVNLPGLGPTEFSGERDTEVTIVGMKGDGVHYPSIDSLTLTRSASGPLGARGSAQSGVIGAQSLAFQQGVNSLVSAAERLASVASSYQLATQQPAQPREPSALEQAITALLIKQLGESSPPPQN